jgi:alanine dehydrogenase
MKIGIPKEIKKNENRVALTPDGLIALVQAGHEVLVEKGAGVGAGISDDEYKKLGATIVNSHEKVFSAEMVYKVKEPIAEEYSLLKKGQILYAYLHLAPARVLTDALLKSGVTGVAFETIQLENGQLPLLEPMSEVAGRLAVQEGAKYLEKLYGGRGLLLGGVPGVAHGNVVVIGGGTAGLNAVKMAVGLGAKVTVLDINKKRLQFYDDTFDGRVETLFSTPGNIEKSLAIADLVVATVLIPGASAPKLVKRQHLKMMKKGSVIVDVSVDQGGCCETTKATYHDDPIFTVDGIIHYCVANMPGAVPLTSTWALAGATLPYALMIANKGLKEAIKDEALRKGLNTFKGSITHPEVAKSLGLPYKKITSADL